jgi:hypothetical protein
MGHWAVGIGYWVLVILLLILCPPPPFLFPILKIDVTAAPQRIRAAKRKVPWNPATMASGGATETSAPADILAINVPNTAPIRETPTVFPEVRDKDSSPEAIPNRSLGTAPITVLLLGDWNKPIPMP